MTNAPSLTKTPCARRSLCSAREPRNPRPTDCCSRPFGRQTRAAPGSARHSTQSALSETSVCPHPRRKTRGETHTQILAEGTQRAPPISGRASFPCAIHGLCQTAEPTHLGLAGGSIQTLLHISPNMQADLTSRIMEHIPALFLATS